MLIELSQLAGHAKTYLDSLPKEKRPHAVVIGLVGELGAGKTTFVQKVAEALGVKEAVTSPTFVLAKRYPTAHPDFKNLVHIDAYRLAPDEPDTIRFGEYVADPDNLVFVEWPDRIPGGMPPGSRHLAFQVRGENAREITEEKP